MSGPPRFQQTGDFHFVTFSCVGRAPLLKTPESREVTLEILERTRKRWDWKIVAYVVMPEHVHVLTDEPESFDLANVMQVWKQETSRRLKSKGAKRFWLPRYYDLNIHGHEKKVAKINYIHMNPVKRGLVKNPEDWKWSSYRDYAFGEKGPVLVDTEWTKG